VPRNTENARRKKSGGDFTPVRIWDILENMYPEIYSVLGDFIARAQTYGPYSFFTYVLNNYNVRQKFIAALGGQIIDPLEEFITICLAYERTRPGTLRHFIKWFITGNSEIKRDMDSGSGVRIVTIHGSKGLQSRVVFLIDTTSVPKSRYIYNLPDGHMPIWVWTPRTPSGISPEFAQIRDAEFDKDTEESYRLLYVAMTRARDELYIYGFTSNKNAPELSWHNMLWNTLSPKVGVMDNKIRISNNDE
jgi:ATP-dependent helicase/nuclease subunit A